jgi:D-glycero-D-manno-heptose 1,7-bisphosphate phosphatase
MKDTLICVDRDGTLIYDDEYHLGRTNNWKKLIKFIPESIKGLKLLNQKLPNAPIYVLTNQPGVSRNDFPLLTEKKADIVTKEIVNRIRKKGIKISGYFICPHPSPKYVKRHGNINFEKKMICNCQCRKPKPGMIKQALAAEDWKAKDTKIYMVGDRASDVAAALNINGRGILIPFVNTPNQKDWMKKLKKKNKYLAKNFLDAAKLIIETEKKER